MAAATAFMAILLILPAAYAMDHTVGDSAGWVQGMDYSTWTSGKTFSAGDTLAFNYGGSHSVDVVNEADYENCAIGNALESYSDGNTVISLNKSGPMHFICPVFGHCMGGMKLAITVSAAGDAPSPALPATPIPTAPSMTLTPTLPFTATAPTQAPIPDSDPTAIANTPTPISDTPSAITPTPNTLSAIIPIPTAPTLTAPTTDTPFLVPSGGFSNLYSLNCVVLGASIAASLFAFIA